MKFALTHLLEPYGLKLKQKHRTVTISLGVSPSVHKMKP